MALTGRLQVTTFAAAAPGTSFPDRLWIWLHVAFVIFTIAIGQGFRVADCA